MVDIADIDKIRDLAVELQEYERGLQLMESGDGSIVRLSWMPASPGVGATIKTEGLVYPPQMLEPIKQFCAARIEAIRHELESLGITGVLARTAPAVTPPSPASKRGARS